MYANLRVTTAKQKVIMAHRVEIVDGKVYVHIDKNDGQSSYAVDGGKIKLAGDVTVQADF